MQPAPRRPRPGRTYSSHSSRAAVMSSWCTIAVLMAGGGRRASWERRVGAGAGRGRVAAAERPSRWRTSPLHAHSGTEEQDPGDSASALGPDSAPFPAPPSGQTQSPRQLGLCKRGMEAGTGKV